MGDMGIGKAVWGMGGALPRAQALEGEEKESLVHTVRACA